MDQNPESSETTGEADHSTWYGLNAEMLVLSLRRHSGEDSPTDDYFWWKPCPGDLHLAP